MSNKVLIGVGAVLIIAAFGIGYFAYNNFFKAKPSPVQTESALQQTPKPSETPSTMQGTLKGLLAQNNITCKTTFPDNQGTGEVFVSNSRMRADVTSSINNQQLITHMILAGEDFYMWQEGQTTGTKMKLDLTKQATAAASVDKKDDASANLDKQLDLKCSPWNPDQTKFTPPSDIKFQDFSSLMAPKVSGSASPAINKSMCDQIADPASKQACLNALP